MTAVYVAPPVLVSNESWEQRSGWHQHRPYQLMVNEETAEEPILTLLVSYIFLQMKDEPCLVFQ